MPRDAYAIGEPERTSDACYAVAIEDSNRGRPTPDDVVDGEP
jgi:hypothetical protein